jgi:hypothetical protein
MVYSEMDVTNAIGHAKEKLGLPCRRKVVPEFPMQKTIETARHPTLLEPIILLAKRPGSGKLKERVTVSNPDRLEPTVAVVRCPFVGRCT